MYCCPYLVFLVMFSNGLGRRQSTGQSPVAERHVVETLFSNYSRTTRPRQNSNETVEVTVSLYLFEIEDFIERRNSLVVEGYFSMSWRDDFLIWNATPSLNSINQLVLSTERVWLPDITLLNTANNDPYHLLHETGSKVFVTKNGEVYFDTPGRIAVLCDADLTYFPFDKQLCFIRFDSWTHTTDTQVLVAESNNLAKVQSRWNENRIWRLVGNWSVLGTNVITKPSGATESYSYVAYILEISRKPMFYYANIIIPSIIISTAELVTFCLATTEVIKIQISVLCLLAYSVFQNMISDQIPRSSKSLPLLILYLDLQMGFIAVIALLGEGFVYSIMRLGKQQITVPTSLFKVCHRLAKVLMIDDLATRSLKHKNARRKNSNFRKWMVISSVAARLNFITYLLAIVVTPFVMFVIVPLYVAP